MAHRLLWSSIDKSQGGLRPGKSQELPTAKPSTITSVQLLPRQPLGLPAGHTAICMSTIVVNISDSHRGGRPALPVRLDKAPVSETLAGG